MCKVTHDSIHDSDINLQMLETRFHKLAVAISQSNKKNLTDINIICEEIFCEILNKVYHLNLVPVSTEFSCNYIAIDLIDKKNRTAFQITSQASRSKIVGTIEKFNSSGLYQDIDNLYFLILSSDSHTYHGNDTIPLKNGVLFSYTQNIINFPKLLANIQKQCTYNHSLLVSIYDLVCMAFDSGRLNYSNILRESEVMKTFLNEKFDDTERLTIGYGDVSLSAYIPWSYEHSLGCMLEFRQYNLSNLFITFDEKTLVESYFVTEPKFSALHFIGRYTHEDHICVQLENIRFEINAYTASHIYQLFHVLQEHYEIAQKYIRNTLGTKDFTRDEHGYLLTQITVKQWNEILFFASHHSYRKTAKHDTWYIFDPPMYNTRALSLYLMPNIHTGIQGTILAKLSVSLESHSNKKGDYYQLYWNPGFKTDCDCMNAFDNVTKWKADYTKTFVENKLLNEAHRYYRRTFCLRWIYKIKRIIRCMK